MRKPIREPQIEERYNSKDWTTQYKVKYYNKEKQMVTYTTTGQQQHTISLQAFRNKIAKYERE